jgi:hypothetical protein
VLNLDFIFSEIIRRNIFLKKYYYKHLDNITDSDVQSATPKNKIDALSESLYEEIKSDHPNLEDISSFLSFIEKYLIDYYEKEIYEYFLRFFSHLKGKFSKISEASEGYKFVRFFLNNLGPISQELYEGRNLFK